MVVLTGFFVLVAAIGMGPWLGDAATTDRVAARDTIVNAGGHCKSGELPRGCTEGSIASVDWPHFLGLVCLSVVQRNIVAQFALDTLSLFDKASAEACMPGFIVTIFVLLGSGTDQWKDQIVRFFPDGRARFNIGVWQVLRVDRVRYNQWTVTMPPSMKIPPPFPPWPFPGLLKRYRDAQDLSSLRQLPPSLRCNEDALDDIEGCGGSEGTPWRELLRMLCSRCMTDHPNGLPCYYDQPLLELLRPLVQSQRQRERQSLLQCPHGLLAALLAFGALVDHSPAEVDAEIWRVRGHGGQPTLVLSACFRSVLGDAYNRFEANVPMMDLSPFPFHTGSLRSARLTSSIDVDYYKSFIGFVSSALTRTGLQHVLLPGDFSAGLKTRDPPFPECGLSSLFVPYEFQADFVEPLRRLREELQDEFGGLWRLVPVSAGLWQIGEEPYRFAPRAGVAFRVFCRECLYVSLYFYVRDDAGALYPLAPWTPCLVPRARVFPVRPRDFAGTAVPFAADTAWLWRSQRPPMVWTPDDPVALSARAPRHSGDGLEHGGFEVSPSPRPCRDAHRRALRRLEQQPQQHRQSLWTASSAAPEMRNRLRPAPMLTPEFDLSTGVYSGMGFFDLMRLREDSEREGLRRYSDKILFKTRLIQDGIPVPRILFMSSRLPDDLPRALEGLGTGRFVAKPTHLAATSFVYVMRDGVNLVNGRPTSLSEVAAGLEKSWRDRHVDDWATESTPPGVIVEELVEPSTKSRPVDSTPDELKCHTFFGELFVCEWVFVRNMTTGEDGSKHFWGAHLVGDRARPSLGHETYGIPNFETRGLVFRDRSCLGCEEPLPLSAERWEQLVKIVERVAAGTDHIRIDVFITPEGGVVVNEANISFLKISKLPPDVVEEMRRRWLEGYRSLHT